MLAQSSTLQSRLDTQNRLIAEQWEYTLRTSPEFASILGDKRYNDRLSDYTPAAIERDVAQTRKFLGQFEAIDTRGFAEQDKLNHDLMVRTLRESAEASTFNDWEMPITQFDGLHINLPQLVTSLSFETVKDYEDYGARLKQIPRVFAEVTANMRKGMADGLIPPGILLVQVASQAGNIATQKAEDTPFAIPTTQIPAQFSIADKSRLTDAILAAVRDSVLPAYVKFTAFVRDEYAPKGRAEIGTSALPNGKERYAFDVRRMTTTTMSVEAIHALGLTEVARIEAEQTVIAKKLGYRNIKAFRDSIPRLAFLHPASRQAILDEYKTYIDQMSAKLPSLFGRLPKARLEILPIEPFREKEASTSYNQGTPDGSRPGHVFVNTYEFEKQLTINNESTAYHEGVPGHHMQISIAQELPSLPPFRQQGGYTAYVEGWALYSERLGKELGFYTDPYKNYGRLDDEMLRAIRLVVDTGIHGKHWTRDQVLDFFRAHSSINEAGIQAETDRYIALPGQALSYKIGQLSMLRMREQAKKALGPKFDIRSFHDELLGAGALPLDILEKRMTAWVQRQAK
ncbi:MAG: hypothetical protein JWM95_981 [Gemmatimonadetes bacterium]|nr:hypothetical protein [Gemmatimonadota bacterium]